MSALVEKWHRRETDAASLRRREAAERRVTERARKVRFQRWARARVLLRDAVVAIDTELAPLGYFLSMADDAVHPIDLAGIEIRLSVDGRPSEMILDLTVAIDGSQRVQTMGGKAAAFRAALPAIERVTVADYSTALLAYVERALSGFDRRSAETCEVCALCDPGA